MGVRVVQKLLGYLNSGPGAWWSFESCENVGTTVVLDLRFELAYSQYSHQLSEQQQLESIEEEGHVSRTNCMMSFNHASHMQLDVLNS